jgi:hypothetical protein
MDLLRKHSLLQFPHKDNVWFVFIPYLFCTEFMFYLCYMYKFYKVYLNILVVNTISVSFNSNTRRGAGTAYPSVFNKKSLKIPKEEPEAIIEGQTMQCPQDTEGATRSHYRRTDNDICKSRLLCDHCDH